MGLCEGIKVFVMFVIGDLLFYYDLNGLLVVKKFGILFMVILINNDGGGIFLFLLQVFDKIYFEELFGMLMGFDFCYVVVLYGGMYICFEIWDVFKDVYQLQVDKFGFYIIELKIDWILRV